MIEISEKNANRILLILGHLSALTFIFLSLVFYKERLFAFDSAYYFFKILVHEGFNIEHNRSISYTSQWLPILAIKSGASLKTISILYSLSFTLFYYVIYIIHAHLFKSPRTGMLLFLILILSTRFKHYNAVSEITASMALSSLFIGWVWIKDEFTRLNAFQKTGIAILLLSLNWTGHPIIFLPILGFLAFFVVYRKNWTDPYFWFIFAATLLVFYLRFTLIPSSGYEANKLEALRKAPEILPGITKVWTYQHLKEYIVDNYAFAWWSYIGALAVLLLRRRFLSAIISFASFAIFVIVVVLIYYRGESVMMLESYYALFGYFWAVPLFAVILGERPAIISSYLWLIGLTIYSYVGIYKQHHFFSQRLAYMDELMDLGHRKGTKNVLLPIEHVDWDRLMVPWALPFASLLYSSIESPEQSTTVYVYRSEDKNEYHSRLNEHDLFLGAHFNIEEFNRSDLPTKFFDLGVLAYKPIAD